MELVYLWVEEYKNIHKQGFNFSPKFNCHYDEDSNELTIEENDKYIENFFGENINVTAIVGKNGSGKSSVNKLILLLLFCKNYSLKENSEQNPIYDDNILEAISPFVNKDLFLIIYDNEFKKISMKVFIKYLYDTFNIQNHLPRKKEEIEDCLIMYSEIKAKDIKSFFIHFNYMLDTLYDGQKDKWIKEIYHKADNYQTPLLLEPYKNNNRREIIDLEKIEYLNNHNFLRFYSIFSFNKKITQFFNPNKIKFYNPKFTFPNNVSDEEFACTKNPIFYKVANKFWNIVKYEQIFLDIKEFDENFCKIMKQIEDWYEKKNYQDINLLYIALKVKTSNKELFNEDEYGKYDNWLSALRQNSYDITLPSNINFENLISTNASDYEVRKIKTCIDFDKNEVYDNNLFLDNLGIEINIEDIKDILSFVPPWVNVEFFEDEKSIKSLSSGEKSFFTFLINLMYQVQNLNDRNEYETIYLLLDEIELGFHPQWQKEYLNHLLFALEKVNHKNINLIFSTHSPFLLSDIPRQNIIFLDKDENGNCKVVDGLKEKKQTFGANIHTLLSDSFFMEDGLMGEFAKGRIEEVIDYLNNKKSPIKNNDEAQKLISIIGEPIIKNQLQKMLDSKRLSKIDEIDSIRTEINDLEKRLKEIEDANDNS